MDNLLELVKFLEKEINNKNFIKSQEIMLQLNNDLVNFYVKNNIFTNQMCKINNNEDILINKLIEKINEITPKYKKIQSEYMIKNNSKNCIMVLDKLSSINKNLSEFYYNPLHVTPKFLNDNTEKEFNKNLSEYNKDYFELLKQEKIVDKLLNNNKLEKPIEKKNKILIITFDDRPDITYIKLHNKNFKDYCESNDIEYKYEYMYNKKLNNNPYWYKIYLTKFYLDTNNYDYVMWVDSDTMIMNNKVDLNKILNSYSSDLYFCDDNQIIQKANAGIFIIKNTTNGRQYLSDCINNFCIKCIKPGENKLKGTWASTCYEQGIMNIVLIKNYMRYSTILPLNIVLCSNRSEYFKLLKNIFIIHYYDTKTDDRNILFDRIDKDLNINNKIIKYS
jgi:hypothetical protein